MPPLIDIFIRPVCSTIFLAVHSISQPTWHLPEKNFRVVIRHSHHNNHHDVRSYYQSLLFPPKLQKNPVQDSYTRYHPSHIQQVFSLHTAPRSVSSEGMNLEFPRSPSNFPVSPSAGTHPSLFSYELYFPPNSESVFSIGSTVNSLIPKVLRFRDRHTIFRLYISIVFDLWSFCLIYFT